MDMSQDPEYQEYLDYLDYLKTQQKPISDVPPAQPMQEPQTGTAAIYAKIAKQAGNYDPKSAELIGKVDEQLSPQGVSQIGAQSLLPGLGKLSSFLGRLGTAAGVGAAAQDVADQGDQPHLPNKQTVSNVLSGGEKGAAAALAAEGAGLTGKGLSGLAKLLGKAPDMMLDFVPGGKYLKAVGRIADSLESAPSKAPAPVSPSQAVTAPKRRIDPFQVQKK